jgi:hypothetical protein
MWSFKNLTFFSLIIGSLAEDSPPISKNGCKITGFSVFHKNIRQAVPLEHVLNKKFPDEVDDTYSGRILLEDYPQKKINIKTNVNTASSCELPQCVKRTFEPNFRRYAEFDVMSNENTAPYTLYRDRSPQKQYVGYLGLTGEAYQSSDCTGTPHSTLTQNVQTV